MSKEEANRIFAERHKIAREIYIPWMKNKFKDSRFLASTVGSFPQPQELRKARVALRKKEITPAAYQELVQKHTLEWLKLQDDLKIDLIVSGEFERQDMAVAFGEKFTNTRIEDFVKSYENRRYRPVNYLGKVEWQEPIALPMFQFVGENTDRFIKETITGPVTLFEWGLIGSEEYDERPELLRADLVAVLRKEIESLIQGGVTILQVDEPAFTAKKWNIEEDWLLIQEAVRGFEEQLYLILHICYSSEEALDRAFPLMLQPSFHQIHIEMANRDYRLVKLLEKHGFGDKDIGLGVIDVHQDRIETVEEIISGIKKVLPIVPPNRIWVTPDCGLKDRSKEVTVEKLKVMVEAAKRAREIF